MFQFPGDLPFEDANALLIDSESLQKTTRTTYEELSKTTTTLTLRTLPPVDIKWICSLFAGVQHLTLERLAFRGRNWTGEIPANLQTLRILDCTIDEDLIKNFFNPGLVSVQLIRTYHSVPFHSVEDQASFRRLTEFLPFTVRHLSTDIAVDLMDFRGLPLLEYFHSEMGFPETWTGGGTITTLICPTLHPMRTFYDFGWFDFLNLGNLQHLRLTSGVTLPEKERLHSKLPNLKTLDVHCYLPPAEEDLILKKLNDDSLLHVLWYLEAEHWSVLPLVHSTFKRLVYTHILPHKVIDIDRYVGTLKRFAKIDETTAYKQLGKHIRHVFANAMGLREWMPMFTKLESLIMHEGRSRFKLANNWDSQSQDRFCRIDRTLTSLTVHGLLCESDLLELHNIRKIDLQNAQDYKLLDFITQNKDHLSSLKLDFKYHGYPMPTLDEDEPQEEYDPMEHNFVFCQLSNLTVLHLTHLEAAFVMELRAEDFPVLDELNLSFKEDYKPPQHEATLNNISRFLQLKSLSVWFNFKPEIDMPVKWLNPLQNLHTLGIVLKITSLLKVLDELPKVTTLEWWGNKYYTLVQMPFEMEMFLKNFLRRNNRQLNIDFKGKTYLMLP